MPATRKPRSPWLIAKPGGLSNMCPGLIETRTTRVQLIGEGHARVWVKRLNNSNALRYVRVHDHDQILFILLAALHELGTGQGTYTPGMFANARDDQ